MNRDDIDSKALAALKLRCKKAFALNDQWESVLSDAYEYYLPNRNLFDRDDVGQDKMDLIFDGTAPTAIQIGASKLQENIAPIWQRWAIHEIPEEIKREAENTDQEFNEDKIRKQLEQQSEVIFDYINRSNFATQFYEMALDLLIGTATILVQENESDDQILSFHAVPQKFIAFEEGPTGLIESHFRKHLIVARNLERTWPNMTLSPQTQTLVDKSPDEKVKCTEAVVRAEDGSFYAVVWVEDEDHVSWFEDYQEFNPFITGRYSKTAGEIRGRGPALQVLPDVKSLNKAKEFILQKAAIDIAGLWTATDDGVMNPYQVTIAPGIVIPVGSNNTANPSLQRLDTSSNLELGLFEVQELQKSIKAALFNDLRDPDGPVRSATEIEMESRELAKRIGSAYGRLQTEVLIPILKAVTSILARRGKIDRIMIDGKAVDVKFTSPLARSQDMEDVINTRQAVGFVLETVGPELVKTSFNIEDFGRWAAEKVGMPAELIRSDDERNQAIQAGMEAAQAAMQNGQEPATDVMG